MDEELVLSRMNELEKEMEIFGREIKLKRERYTANMRELESTQRSQLESLNTTSHLPTKCNCYCINGKKSSSRPYDPISDSSGAESDPSSPSTYEGSSSIPIEISSKHYDATTTTFTPFSVNQFTSSSHKGQSSKGSEYYFKEGSIGPYASTLLDTAKSKTPQSISALSVIKSGTTSPRKKSTNGISPQIRKGEESSKGDLSKSIPHIKGSNINKNEKCQQFPCPFCSLNIKLCLSAPKGNNETGSTPPPPPPDHSRPSGSWGTSPSVSSQSKSSSSSPPLQTEYSTRNDSSLNSFGGSSSGGEESSSMPHVSPYTFKYELIIINECVNEGRKSSIRNGEQVDKSRVISGKTIKVMHFESEDNEREIEKSPSKIRRGVNKAPKVIGEDEGEWIIGGEGILSDLHTRLGNLFRGKSQSKYEDNNNNNESNLGDDEGSKDDGPVFPSWSIPFLSTKEEDSDWGESAPFSLTSQYSSTDEDLNNNQKNDQVPLSQSEGINAVLQLDSQFSQGESPQKSDLFFQKKRSGSKSLKEPKGYNKSQILRENKTRGKGEFSWKDLKSLKLTKN